LKHFYLKKQTNNNSEGMEVEICACKGKREIIMIKL